MPGRPLSRRTTLGSALAAPLVLAACDIDPPSDGTGSPTSSPAPPEDSELVATVVAALVDAGAVLAAATAAAPVLDARLEPLVAAHTAHQELLAGAVPDAGLPTAAPVTVPAQPEAALRAVRRSEQQLLRVLRETCVGAASGDLARVLASMAASTSQHYAGLGGAA